VTAPASAFEEIDDEVGAELRTIEELFEKGILGEDTYHSMRDDLLQGRNESTREIIR
jgi:hypothetical protein